MKHPRKPAKRKAAPARKGGGKPRRADVASILLAINRRWLSSLDPAVLLPAIVQLTRESFDVSDTTLLLLGSNGQEFVQHLASGPHFHKLDQRFFQQIRDGGVTGWVATHRRRWPASRNFSRSPGTATSSSPRSCPPNAA